ncbi:MAG: glycosyltransferase [Lachnospiraceae bacterium]
MAKVSIIVPTYNVEMYLDECMESITRQTLKDIEIICINDGSTDNSLEILKKYAKKDERIILVDKKNGGYGIAMNIGLEKATGEYIGIVEPDDFVPLNMYEDLYEIAKKNDLDFVKADFYRFKRDSKTGNMELKYFHLSQKSENYNIVFNPSERPETLRYVMNTWSGIYKREFLNKNNIRHHETPGASFQDNGFYFQTFVYGKRAMIVDKPYYMNRRDNPNSSVNNKDKVYCINIEYDYIREILRQDIDIWNRFKYMYWVKKYTNYRAAIDRIGDQYKREYIIQMSKEFRRARDLKELKKEVFKEQEWNNIQFILSDPDGFYYTIIDDKSNVDFPKRNRVTKLEKELKEIKTSKSFAIGRTMTAVPRKVRKIIKGK